jgi:integrase/recombinase XerD
MTRSRTVWNLPIYCLPVREACTLRTADAYDAQGRALPKLIIRKGNTKGKLATRTIPIIDDL